MNNTDWKKRIYDSYVSNGFGEVHSKKKFEMLRKYFKKNYSRFMPENKNCRILELGCGMGEFYYFCKKEGYKNYQGIDASKENIDFIKKHLGSKSKVSVDNIFDYFKRESIEQYYDVVVLNDVIEHLTKPEVFDLLDLVYKCLRKDGVFLIKTPNMANPFVSTAGRYIAFDHEVGFTEYSMNQVLFTTGFKDIKIIGTDIYVFNPFISFAAKISSKIMNSILFLLSALYGRTSLKIFEKDILAAAYKR